jgi:N-acetylmuramoyl-L-alanine amidase
MLDSANPAVRRRTVWLSLLAAMTSVGGLLLALEGRPTASLHGMALTASSPVSSSIEAIFSTRADVSEDLWDGVVIYDSGAMTGSAASLAATDKARNLLGLGSHFVIGNGSGMDDGELHVGYRWLDQLPGAHAAGPNQSIYNKRYIGITLIGDGDRRPFTQAQKQRLVELLDALQQKMSLPASSILLARDISATTSPGTLFPEAEIRSQLASE